MDMLTNTAESPPVLTIQGARATISLNRPDHMNRLHSEDLLVLKDIFALLSKDTTIRVVVLTGVGRVFCAGYNIAELAPSSSAGVTSEPGEFELMVEALARLPLPTICRFNGSVYGGATDMALACDFRVGTQSMELRMPAVRLGLHYYPSGLKRYVSRLGLAQAKRLFLLGQAVQADELVRIGYLDYVAPLDALDAAVDELVHALSQGAPLAMQGMKCSLNEISIGEADDAILRQREVLTMGSDDLQEGAKAWKERRKPNFLGH